MLMRTCQASLYFATAMLIWGHSEAKAQFSIQNMTSRTFVTGFTPVIGRNGGVGGVLVDARGVVQKIDIAKKMRSKWNEPQGNQLGDVRTASKLRMVSLSRLNETLKGLIESKQQPSEDMFFLAGLQRVEYVFVHPDQNDILLAGPAGDWRTNALGETVSIDTGTAVVRLDDLMDALRSVDAARKEGISCSIEPTTEGLQRYANLKRPRSNQAAVAAMEKALGMQQVLLNGISPDSHFASVMVASDYLMKRYAMGFDQAPVPRMPSYMSLLQKHSDGSQLSSPRWWMAANYEPIQRSADGLAWHIRGQGVKTLTEDEILTRRGERVSTNKHNPLAEKWADTMTDSFARLMKDASAFGELRNCFDLCVVAALIANEDLIGMANMRLDMLLDPGRIAGPKFVVPKSVPSKATLVRGKRGWLVSVSGGVDIDSWQVAKNQETDAGLKALDYAPTKRWWWDNEDAF